MGIIAGLPEGIKAGIKGFPGRVSLDWVIVAILLLASSGAFGLGYLAGKDAAREETGITVTELPLTDPDLRGGAKAESGEALAVPGTTMAAGGEYVASKTGKSYHLPWCSGAKLIKEENKIWFASKEEAEAKGYQPAGNCPGI